MNSSTETGSVRLTFHAINGGASVLPAGEKLTLDNGKQEERSTFKAIINARAKVRSPQVNYLKHHGAAPGGLRHLAEESRRERTGNTNMITTIARSQVITELKGLLGPRGQRAALRLSPLGRGLCRVQIAGEIWFTSPQPPTGVAAKITSQLVPITGKGAIIT
ncbi:hypothetical protein CesoFtcFv8_027496 [Champsocephalus esox]|uniref:Uncharacterized protein n=1 Tax=Champsocephalus esox TaxID=159716 RepID=A0AAN8AYX1_9TELE|nr:hypothetical protein CesoFtcFv8_027496 [Champsocephalus esox]